MILGKKDVAEPAFKTLLSGCKFALETEWDNRDE